MKQFVFLVGFLLNFALLHMPIAAQSPLNVDFASDTLHVCMHEPFQIVPQISGGTEPYIFSWNTGDTGADLDVIPGQTFETIYLEVQDQDGEIVRDSVVLKGYPECVFPGDGNGDRLANNLDILALGQSFGHSGNSRPDPHLNWIGQPAFRWHQTTSTGADFVHSDTDGNGHVDRDDVEAININYSGPQTQPGVSGGNVKGIPMYIEVTSPAVSPGDTLKASIMLGTSDQPVDSAYGLAFSINYSNLLLESENLSIDFSNSWLGDTGTDMIALDRNFPGLGQVDIGISRTDQIQIGGYGEVAAIIVVIDDLEGKKNNIVENITLSIDKISAFSVNEKVLQVAESEINVGVVLSKREDFASQGVKLYPNPAQNSAEISWDDPTLELENIRLLNLVGSEVPVQIKQEANRVGLSGLDQLSKGIYILEALFNNQLITTKLLVK